MTMGYILEFRDEEQYGELMSKMHKAKKAICEAFDAMEEADGDSEMGERRSYGGRGNYRDYRDRGYRDHGYRYDDERMDMRRDSRGRYM